MDETEMPQDAIAILAMACRFPGAATPEEYWRNLREGVESITFFSDQELLEAGVAPALLRDPALVKARGVLDGVELFDAPFFGFSPREAEWTDPQHRVLLECAWEALEAAGYAGDELTAPVGVFAGSGTSHYFAGAPHGPEMVFGGASDFLATRISYKLNLRGPSFTVQTACSTSLVAVHLACKSLIDGECDLALAGGVSIRLPQASGYLYQEGGIHSPDGHCRAFDARAQGTVGGSGAGIVVLKRLEDALADGDPVRAVIRASAINNDGAAKVGFTAPGVDGQARVIAEAQALAQVDAGSIGYVEAHGTGTPLGDPIEVAALTQAFRQTTRRQGFCALGSVKTNFGHLDAAAGIAGLIKVVLALEHRELPPSLHFETPNPRIDFAGSPFYVNGRLAPWPAEGGPRRAGVSSFGMGGTNAHAVLEEAPAAVSTAAGETPPQLLVLSARTETALDAASRRLAEHLRQHPDLPLADVAWTLQAGRRSFEHRRIAVCSGAGDAVSALSGADPKRCVTRARPAADPPVVFLFPGQGAQHVHMGRDLYARVPAFRRHLDECCGLLRDPLGRDLRELLFPAPEVAAEAERQLGRTAVIQPALLAIEVSLAKTWMEWGVRPAALIGHSVGEYAAACLAGVFSLADALALVAERGALIQALPEGAMLAVALPEEEVAPLLGDEVSLAAVNASDRCVVSGPEPAVARVEAELARRNVHSRRLRTSHAFHSAMLEPVLAPFVARLRAVKREEPGIPFVSNLTGDWFRTGEATDPGYWVRHLRETVRFAEGLRRLTDDPERIYLEVGPGNTLGQLVRQNLRRPAAAVPVISSMRPPREPADDQAVLLRAAGELWLAGVRIDWEAVHEDERRSRVTLPTYPLERQPYWLAAPSPQPAVAAPAAPVDAGDDIEELVAQQLRVLALQLDELLGAGTETTIARG